MWGFGGGGLAFGIAPSPTDSTMHVYLALGEYHIFAQVLCIAAKICSKICLQNVALKCENIPL